jgi:hypothetical protein
MSLCSCILTDSINRTQIPIQRLACYFQVTRVKLIDKNMHSVINERISFHWFVVFVFVSQFGLGAKSGDR